MPNKAKKTDQQTLMQEVAAIRAVLQNIKDLLQKANETSSDSWDWITGKEVQALLGLSERSLHYYRAEGMIKAAQLGRKLYYRKKEIRDLLMSRFSSDVSGKI